MSEKSIDGLAPAPKKRPASNMVNFPKKKKGAKKTATKSRKIGIEEAHTDFWDDEVTGLGLTRKSHEKIELGSEESLKDTEQSEKDLAKQEKRAEKAAKKAKKRQAKKAHRVRRIVLRIFGILLFLLIAAAIIFYFI